MKSERVTQAWEFYRNNCQGFKEPMRQEFRKLDEYVSIVESENAKLQERVEWLDGECRKSMGAAHKFFEMVGEYQKENAKLRELVREVWHLFTEHGAVNPCDLPVVDAVRDRMRELGIEVE